MAFLLSVVAFAPIMGVIVRYRLSYHPMKLEESQRVKSVLFDGDITDLNNVVPPEKEHSPEVPNSSGPTQPAGTNTHTPPTFTSVFKSVWRAEQFEGLFKGAVVTAGLIWLFARGFASPAPNIMHSDQGYLSLPLNLIYVAFITLTYRSIATTHRLSTSQPKQNFKLLFTPAELSSPSFLSHIPFLRNRIHLPLTHTLNPALPTALPPFIISIFIGILLNHPKTFPRLIGTIGPLLDYDDNDTPWQTFDHPRWSEWRKVGMYLASTVVGTLLGCPLDVITTRLAVQRWEGKEETELRPHDIDVENLTQEIERGMQRPDGLRLSCDEVKYKNTLDCFQRIVKEEGWGVLYRSWWLTFLGNWFTFLR